MIDTYFPGAGPRQQPAPGVSVASPRLHAQQTGRDVEFPAPMVRTGVEPSMQVPQFRLAVVTIPERTVEPMNWGLGRSGAPFFWHAGLGAVAGTAGADGNSQNAQRALIMPPDRFVGQTWVRPDNVYNGRLQRSPSRSIAPPLAKRQ